MRFSEKLNEYIGIIGCTSKELAESAGLSEGTISRYRKGERVPSFDSKQLKGLSDGLYYLAVKNNISLDANDIYIGLNGTINHGIEVDYNTYVINLNKLISVLDIRSGELARGLHFDPSYISRILSGNRHPADISKFNANISSYIARYYSNNRYLSSIASLFECRQSEINTPASLYDKTVTWLGTNTKNATNNPIRQFLKKMDEFDLDQYIQSLHFDNMNMPAAYKIPTEKTYYGLNAMMQGEIDFISATMTSPSMDDVILYSDMPIEDMGKNMQFAKNWMYGMAAMLNKGLHLHIIHDVHRPFDGMMLGLEGNIPMYMTGQISPYYLRHSQSGVFTHLLKVSGDAALHGEGISGHHMSGRYRLAASEEEVKYYKTRAHQLLEKSLPLMNIYRKDRKKDFISDTKKLWMTGDRKIILSSLPIFTISEELLMKILKRNNVVQRDINSIKSFRREYASNVENFLKNNMLTIEVSNFDEESFNKGPVYMELSGIFYEKNISYTFEEYREHLNQTRRFAEENLRCTLNENTAPAFKNITFAIIKNKCVVVSKGKSPIIHFVIHHPKMVQAFQNYIPLIKD